MDAKYPHIVAKALEPPPLPIDEGQEKPATKLLTSHDPDKREHLAFIIASLNKLEWKHYDVKFTSPLAHIQIIGHPPIPACDDVIRHCADNFNL